MINDSELFMQPYLVILHVSLATSCDFQSGKNIHTEPPPSQSQLAKGPIVLI